jgi:hypothetical protein
MLPAMVEADAQAASAVIGQRARSALGEALERARRGVARDGQGYVMRLDDNFLPKVTLSEVQAAFAAGAGNELQGKMRAPWSSSALAINSFAPWQNNPADLTLAGISSFTETLAFEAKCPNGVSRIPPHLDVLLERGDGIVAVESKCTEYLSPKTAKVANAYRALETKGDERAKTRWFAALSEMPRFRLLDAYQLVKHYLGLSLTYPQRPLTLVYLYWEPANAGSLPTFGQHREEIKRFAEIVAGDVSCRFESLSYPDHWRELEAQAAKPDWLDSHLAELRRRYLVDVT